MDFSLTPEQRMFQEAIARFAQEKLETYVKRMEETDDFPVEVFKLLGDLGYLGIHFPAEDGGSGADFMTFCLFIEEVSKASAATAGNVLLPPLMGSPPAYPAAT